MGKGALTAYGSSAYQFVVCLSMSEAARIPQLHGYVTNAAAVLARAWMFVETKSSIDISREPAKIWRIWPQRIDARQRG